MKFILKDSHYENIEFQIIDQIFVCRIQKIREGLKFMREERKRNNIQKNS